MPHADVLHAIELLGREVAPAVRERAMSGSSGLATHGRLEPSLESENSR